MCLWFSIFIYDNHQYPVWELNTYKKGFLLNETGKDIEFSLGIKTELKPGWV